MSCCPSSMVKSDVLAETAYLIECRGPYLYKLLEEADLAIKRLGEEWLAGTATPESLRKLTAQFNVPHYESISVYGWGLQCLGNYNIADLRQIVSRNKRYINLAQSEIEKIAERELKVLKALLKFIEDNIQRRIEKKAALCFFTHDAIRALEAPDRQDWHGEQELWDRMQESVRNRTVDVEKFKRYCEGEPLS